MSVKNVMLIDIRIHTGIILEEVPAGGSLCRGKITILMLHFL